MGRKGQISVSGGVGLGLMFLGSGMTFAFPGMIVPPVWGVAMIALGLLLTVGTIVAAITSLFRNEPSPAHVDDWIESYRPQPHGAEEPKTESIRPVFRVRFDNWVSGAEFDDRDAFILAFTVSNSGAMASAVPFQSWRVWVEEGDRIERLRIEAGMNSITLNSKAGFDMSFSGKDAMFLKMEKPLEVGAIASGFLVCSMSNKRPKFGKSGYSVHLEFEDVLGTKYHACETMTGNYLSEAPYLPYAKNVDYPPSMSGDQPAPPMKSTVLKDDGVAIDPRLPHGIENMRETITQNHSGSGNNVVNMGQQPFDLTHDILAETALKIGSAHDVRVESYGPQGEAQAFVARLAATLGRPVQHALHVGMSNEPPAKGVHVTSDGLRALVSFNPT